MRFVRSTVLASLVLSAWASPAPAQITDFPVETLNGAQSTVDEAFPSLFNAIALSPEEKGEILAEALRMAGSSGRIELLRPLADFYGNEATRKKLTGILGSSPEPLSALLDLFLSKNVKWWVYPKLEADGVFNRVTHLALDLAGENPEAEQIVKIGKLKNSWAFFDVDDVKYYRIFEAAIGSRVREISLAGTWGMATNTFQSRDGTPIYADQILLVLLSNTSDPAFAREAWKGYLASSYQTGIADEGRFFCEKWMRAQAILRGVFFNEAFTPELKTEFFAYFLDTSPGAKSVPLLREIAGWIPSSRARQPEQPLSPAQLKDLAGYLAGTKGGVDVLYEMIVDDSFTKWVGRVTPGEIKRVAKFLLVTAEVSEAAMEKVPGLVDRRWIMPAEARELLENVAANGTEPMKVLATATLSRMEPGNGGETRNILLNLETKIDQTGKPVDQVLRGPGAKPKSEMKPEELVKPDKIGEIAKGKVTKK